ncbi:DUF6518 family protein [Actinoallomurus sp. NPDC052308]|uniref:DUF6518 family protein n=1 Tax=Actinoallomurus sp. NPDC052308 TaxID=3155530 RepID=UPI00342F2E87
MRRTTERSTTGETLEEETTGRPAILTWVVRILAAPAIGIVMGAVTDVLQKYLDLPWNSLVNAASPWLAPAFAVGALQRRLWGAAVAGLATCVFELVGYYVTAAARGYFAGGGHGILLFWGGCAVAGGPVLGMAGRLWWRGPGRLRGLGAAVLAAAFLAEAIVAYGWRLHYTASAVLFAGLGVAVGVLLGLRGRRYVDLARWLLVVLPIGLLAELALGLVYDQSF